MRIGPIERWDNEFFICSCSVPPAGLRLPVDLFMDLWAARANHHWWMISHRAEVAELADAVGSNPTEGNLAPGSTPGLGTT